MNKKIYICEESYLFFLIIKSICSSLLTIVACIIVKYFFLEDIMSKIILLIIVLVPFDIFYDIFSMKNKELHIDIDNNMITIVEGVFLKSITNIPITHIYSTIEYSLPFVKKNFGSIGFKTIVEEYKFKGVNIKHLKDISSTLNDLTLL